MKTILIVPCYNEEKRLNTQEFARLFANPDLFLLFVNDGSKDGTLKILNQFKAQNSNRMDVYDLPKNSGKAEAVRLGLIEAIKRGAESVGYTDADLATPIEEILRVKTVLDEKPFSVVLGSRVKLLGTNIQRNEMRHYLGRVFATIASIILQLAVYDTQCGMKYFRITSALQKSIANPFVSRWAFDVELIGRLRKYGLNKEDFIEVPLQTWIDVKGSKLTFKDMARTGFELLRIARELRK